MTPVDNSISYRQLASIFRARRRTMLVVLLVMLGLASLLSLVVPKRYTASASVMVDGRSKDPIDGSALMSLSIPGYLSTQVGILKSERVTLNVIHALKLGERAENREEWVAETNGQGDYESWLATKVAKKLDARPARDSSVIDISFSNRDAKLATDIVNAYLRAYVDTTLELRVDQAKKYNGFFDERTKLAREDLEKAQRKLSKYQQTAGIMTTDERVDIENAKLSELSTRLIALQAVSSESSTRSSQAGRSRDSMPEVLSDGVVTGLRSELSRQEATLTELRLRLGESHPQVVQAKAGISQVRSKIDQETAKVASSLNVSNSIDRTRLAELSVAVDAQRSKVMQMKLGRDEASILQRDAENAQRTYETMIGRLTQTSLESQSNQTNFSVLKQATLPGEASFPRLGLNLAIAAALGLLLGFPIALIREMRDRRIYVEEDIVRGLQMPLLATLPIVSSVAKARLKASSGAKARVLGLPRLGRST